MIERFAVDTSAVVDLMRVDRETPAPLVTEADVYLPVPVLGELFVGAFSSRRPDHHVNLLTRVASGWKTLTADVDTARIYAQIRVKAGNVELVSRSKLNDFWIAALCIQHNLPLLTTDRGFDHIEGLTAMHW